MSFVLTLSVELMPERALEIRLFSWQYCLSGCYIRTSSLNKKSDITGTTSLPTVTERQCSFKKYTWFFYDSDLSAEQNSSLFPDNCPEQQGQFLEVCLALDGACIWILQLLEVCLALDGACIWIFSSAFTVLN